MKKLRELLITGIMVCVLFAAFSYQSIRVSGEKQRQLDIGYLAGYADGKEAMGKEYDDQLKAIKHARKLTKAGYEIVD